MYIYVKVWHAGMDTSEREGNEPVVEVLDRTPINLIKLHYENICKVLPPVLENWEDIVQVRCDMMVVSIVIIIAVKLR